MNKNKQTAVEWLVQELKKSTNYRGLQNIGITHQELIEQAKEMEKQQIINAYLRGIKNYDPIFKSEQYYNEEYGSKESDKCCTPKGQIKRYIDCIGCDRKPKTFNNNEQQ